MITLTGVRLPLCGRDELQELAVRAALRSLGLSRGGVREARLRRASYDARHGRVEVVCSVSIETGDELVEERLCERFSNASRREKSQLTVKPGGMPLAHRPIVVGFGPAGMFAAYILAKYGYRPLVLERGPALEERVKAVEGFFDGGALNERANVQYGEGGAGAFSDGKLTTRINDPLCELVLETFAELGAPDEILWQAKPHVGTDRLRAVVKNMRAAIIESGGEVRFLSPLDDIILKNGRLEAAVCEGVEIPCEALVLACGHSSRDTLEALARRGVTLEGKAFSVGARIEHPQELIDRAIWGRLAGDERLPHGEYALSARVSGRAVYTFCMCPGGTVVAAASHSGGVVTNGMSVFARDGKNANAALVAAVGPDDFGRDPFAGYDYRDALERAAFAAGGGDYTAPAQDVGGFLTGRASLNTSLVEPSYPRGVHPYDLNTLFSSEITSALRGGIAAFGKKLKGFDNPGALLTAPETRTSSPVRITRGESREALGIEGLYPCGEGAGYAGGITSAAVDGIKTALGIIEKYSDTEISWR